MSHYAVTNPATNALAREYPTATNEDVESALSSVASAYRTWSRKTTVAERAATMKKAADLMTQRTDALADIIVEEMGKTKDEAVEELELSAAILAYYADNAEEFMKDEDITLLAGEGSAMIRRFPVGPLLGIMPWNFPYYQVARFAGPNLIIGNPIILKHAPQCPASAAALAELFHDAGFPAEAYVNLYATNEQCETIIADDRVQGVSLTGSERAGSAVAEIAGRNLKKIVLELGGSDPFVLLSTDDMDAVVEDAVVARAYNAGQVCNAGKRFIVVADLYDEFVTKFTAKLLEGSGQTPLSSAAAEANLKAQIDRAVAAGATYESGAEINGEGAFVASGVLTDVTPDNPAYYEEFFGPIAMVFKVAGEDEAVEKANDTCFGLGSYVYSTDPDQAARVADQIEAGMVFVNCVGADGPELPFGGVKRSGFGRELGRFGMEEFVNKKMIRTA